MVEVSQRDLDGSITYCRLHDLLRDLAIQKAKDDKFLMVCSKNEDLQNCSQMRRLAIHDSKDEEREKIYYNIASASPNVRSLFGWNGKAKVAEMMHLRVLSNINNRIPYELENIENFGRLNQLRYVKLQLRVESKKDIQNFQKFIGGMRFLQTLDLEGSRINCDLPDCLWYVKTLRHVLVDKRKHVSGPLSSVDLANLQTLSGVIPRESWEAEGLPKIPDVKILGIRSSKESQWNTIAALLGTVEHLISLNISGDDIPLNIIDMRSYPFYHRLQSLKLISLNEWDRSDTKKISLNHVMLPIHLTKLNLVGTQFQEDPMPVLSKLDNLSHLILANCKIHQLSCFAGGFGQLEILEIWNLEQLEELQIEEGAMPVLKELDVIYCQKLPVPSGLQYLTVLQKLKWMTILSKAMQNRLLSICNHVPSIKFLSME